MNVLNLKKLAVASVVGVSAVAFFGVAESAKAADVTINGVQVQTTVFGKEGNTTGTFATEMTRLDFQVDLSGQTLTFRESPTLASTGQTTITDIGGGEYQIVSFFDLNIEASLDGTDWRSVTPDGPVRVTLAPQRSATPTGVNTSDPSLPPIPGGYLSPDNVHLLINQFPELKPFFMQDIFHSGFFNIQRISDGNGNEIETFSSSIQADIQSVPEPSATVPLALIGLSALWSLKRKQEQN